MRVFHGQKNIIIRHLRVRSVLRVVSNVLHGMQEIEKEKALGGVNLCDNMNLYTMTSQQLIISRIMR